MPPREVQTLASGGYDCLDSRYEHVYNEVIIYYEVAQIICC